MNVRLNCLCHRRTLVLAAVFICCNGSLAMATETFTVPPASGVEPELTIHLPAGWKMASSEEDVSARDRFVFESPEKNGPYIFCRIEKVDRDTRDARLESAMQAQHRQFLSGGEPAVEYFDSDLGVAWKRAPQKGDFVVVDVTGYGNAVLHFKLFTPQKEFRTFATFLQRIVDNIELHGERPQVRGFPEMAKPPLSDADLESLFAVAEESRTMKYVLMIMIAVIIIGLITVERTIHYRRHREAMQELDRQKQERLAAGGASRRKATLRDAEEYFKHVGKKNANNG